MNLRNKKILKDEDLKKIASTYGPIEVKKVKTSEDAPIMTELHDKTGLVSCHYMAEDLMNYAFSEFIECLPSDYSSVGKEEETVEEVVEEEGAPIDPETETQEGPEVNPNNGDENPEEETEEE